MATIRQLTAEIITQIKTLDAFNHPSVVKAFSIYDLEDFKSVVEFGGLPLVGVAYEGSAVAGNEAIPVATKTRAASIREVSFSIVIGLEYGSAVSGVDPKPDGLDLLDGIRLALMGYRGVNNRPWKFLGESPLEGNLENVIFYGQMWQTLIPIQGNQF